MFRFIFILSFFLTLYANDFYAIDYHKELKVLEAFDIEPSFLYDQKMNTLFLKTSKEYQDDFLDSIERAYIYIPAMKNILAQNNIPEEFIYLAMVESHFSSLTVSNKEAVGIWQFIPETAKDYNLKIDKYVDERKDIIKSTQAASKFLKNLYKKFKKWYLVIIAYNCGAGRLEKAIKKADSDDLMRLLDRNGSFLPKESQRYIRKVVAYTLMGNNDDFLQKREHIHFLNIGNSYSISTIKLPSGESLKRVSKLLNIPFEDLRSLNRHLKYEFIPPSQKRYSVYIPYAKLTEFKERYFEKAIQNCYKVHIVKEGDNLKRISEIYDVSYISLVTLNKLKNSKLTEKQQLIIPTK